LAAAGAGDKTFMRNELEIVINDKALAENHKVFLRRNRFYKAQGFDQLQARENIVKAIPGPAGKVLEIGTGKGYLTRVLAREADSVTTLDINADEQKIARLNVGYDGLEDKVCFEIGDAEQLSYPDRSFDTVVCAFTFHHFKDHFRALAEMLRVAKSSLVLTDFNRAGFELINKAHEAEGRTHDQGGLELKYIEKYLRDKNISFSYIQDKWQDIYVVQKKGGV
jgi:ubiquinone/menaquinone biosynthesis C-methylase UbiE